MPHSGEARATRVGGAGEGQRHSVTDSFARLSFCYTDRIAGGSAGGKKVEWCIVMPYLYIDEAKAEQRRQKEAAQVGGMMRGGERPPPAYVMPERIGEREGMPRAPR